jgi:hypothetical protein
VPQKAQKFSRKWTETAKVGSEVVPTC